MNDENKKIEILAHIPLEGSVNTRHLGGYKAGDRVTKDYAFFRCESPFHMTEGDLDKLYSLGVRAVIDLRSGEEIENEPNPFNGYRDVSFHNISLLDSARPPHFSDDFTMGDLYVRMLDLSQEGFKKAFRIILDTDGGVLFHCSAGKDRTGVLAALLLLTAGVDRETVEEEYAYTQILLAPWVEQKLEEIKTINPGAGFNPMMLQALPEYIHKALDHLIEKYGDVRNYLREIGLDDAEIDRLADRI